MKRYFYTVTITAILLFTGQTNAVNIADTKAQRKAVLITGASTGIGRKITEVLSANGYFVYAGARKQKDIDALNRIENVQAIKLDVTIGSEIDTAVQTVRKGNRGLYGLVNYAGVGSSAPLIEVDEQEVKWLFDVNVFGVLRITQAFAPMIIESKGRIATIGSIGGIASAPMLGAYRSLH